MNQFKALLTWGKLPQEPANQGQVFTSRDMYFKDSKSMFHSLGAPEVVSRGNPDLPRWLLCSFLLEPIIIELIFWVLMDIGVTIIC